MGRLDSGQEFHCESIYVDPDYDIEFFHCDLDCASYPVLGLGEQSDSEDPGQLEVSGFPIQSNGIRLKRSQIEGRRVNSEGDDFVETFQYQGGVSSGFSGSPLLRSDRESCRVVGMAYLGSAQAATSRFISSDKLVQLLARLGESSNIALSKTPESVSALGAIWNSILPQRPQERLLIGPFGTGQEPAMVFHFVHRRGRTPILVQQTPMPSEGVTDDEVLPIVSNLDLDTIRQSVTDLARESSLPFRLLSDDEWIELFTENCVDILDAPPALERPQSVKLPTAQSSDAPQPAPPYLLELVSNKADRSNYLARRAVRAGEHIDRVDVLPGQRHAFLTYRVALDLDATTLDYLVAS